jgi:hypothetical protein
VTDSPSSKRATRKWLYGLLGVSGFVTLLLFEHFGIFQYFWVSIISIVALSFAVWENRSYHKEIWFWITLFAFTALHLFLVLIVGEHKWLVSIGHGTGGGVAFLAIVDGLIITAAIRFPDWITSSFEWIYGGKMEGTAEK